MTKVHPFIICDLPIGMFPNIIKQNNQYIHITRHSENDNTLSRPTYVKRKKILSSLERAKLVEPGPLYNDLLHDTVYQALTWNP